MYYVVNPFRNLAGHVGVDFLSSFPAETWYNEHIFARAILHQVSVWNGEKIQVRFGVYSETRYPPLICYNNEPQWNVPAALYSLIGLTS